MREGAIGPNSKLASRAASVAFAVSPSPRLPASLPAKPRLESQRRQSYHQGIATNGGVSDLGLNIPHIKIPSSPASEKNVSIRDLIGQAQHFCGAGAIKGDHFLSLRGQPADNPFHRGHTLAINCSSHVKTTSRSDDLSCLRQPRKRLIHGRATTQVQKLLGVSIPPQVAACCAPGSIREGSSYASTNNDCIYVRNIICFLTFVKNSSTASRPEVMNATQSHHAIGRELRFQ